MEVRDSRTIQEIIESLYLLAKRDYKPLEKYPRNERRVRELFLNIYFDANIYLDKNYRIIKLNNWLSSLEEKTPEEKYIVGFADELNELMIKDWRGILTKSKYE